MTLEQVAMAIGARIRGDPLCRVDRIEPLDRAGAGALSWLGSPLWRPQLAQTAASAVILAEKYARHCPTNALLTAQPLLGFARAAALLGSGPAGSGWEIHPSAAISENARIHECVRIDAHAVVGEGVAIEEGVCIGAGCVIEAGVVIGANSRLKANVNVAERCIIGENVIIHPGAVIGADGFVFVKDGGAWVKIPHVGRVVIENDVEIGANSTIDRGTLQDTVIEQGVKLDNQIQIGHNTRVGAHSAVAGCTCISGDVRIGRHCTIAGGVGIAASIELVDHVHISGMSRVTKSILERGVYSSGTPLQTNRAWHRNAVRFKQLDAIARRLDTLESGSIQALC